MKTFLLILAMALTLGQVQPAAAQGYKATAPKLGHYGCFKPGTGRAMNYMLSFALTDASTYIDDEGKSGSYSYDSATGILSMTGGSHQGQRWTRNSEISYQELSAKGQPASGAAVWDAKDPNKRPW